MALDYRLHANVEGVDARGFIRSGRWFRRWFCWLRGGGAIGPECAFFGECRGRCPFRILFWLRTWGAIRFRARLRFPRVSSFSWCCPFLIICRLRSGGRRVGLGRWLWSRLLFGGQRGCLRHIYQPWLGCLCWCRFGLRRFRIVVPGFGRARGWVFGSRSRLLSVGVRRCRLRCFIVFDRGLCVGLVFWRGLGFGLRRGCLGSRELNDRWLRFGCGFNWFEGGRGCGRSARRLRRDRL